MADDRLVEAIDIVARRAIWSLIDNELGDLWGDEYADIGEHDWVRVEERIEAITDLLRPDPTEFEAAYEFLEARAEDDG